MAEILCFVNASKKPESQVVWLVPRTKGLLKSNPFVNFASKAESGVIADLVRDAFTKGVSYEISLNIEAVKASSNGESLFVKTTLDKFVEKMSEVTRVEPEIDKAALAKVEALRQSLAKKPVARVSAEMDCDTTPLDDDFDLFDEV
jgi:hypothetical protein